MRILQVISSLNPDHGGPIENIKQTTNEFISRGHSAEILTLDSPNENWLSEISFKVHPLDGVGAYRYSPKLVHWLKSNASNFDAVIVRGLWQYAGFGVWRALRNSNVPYYVFPHGMLDPWFKNKYPIKHLKKWLYWPWAEYRVLRDAKAVFFTNEKECFLARKSFWFYSCNEKIIPYGVNHPPPKNNTDCENFFKAYPRAINKRIVLYLGRLHQKKGCDILIRAFAEQLSRDSLIHLVIAGPDQDGLKKDLDKLCHELGIDEHVTWTGSLLGAMKWSAYYLSDIFVLPSHQENFGISVIEAMSCGTPVLITDKVNIWEKICSDKAGLASADSVRGISDILAQWIALREDEKNNMRVNALKSFSNNFTLIKTVDKLIADIQEGK